MCWSGVTSNYLRAYAYADRALRNDITKMKMLSSFRRGLLGMCKDIHEIHICLFYG
jgi:hypothetical protein